MPPDRVFIDVSTLLESQWTGLAAVTAEIVRHFLEFDEGLVRFFARDRLMSREMVEIALEVGDGVGLAALWDAGLGFEGWLNELPASELIRSAGVYPHFRRGLTRFGRQILVVHDISFATMPELHSPSATLDFRRRLARDCHQSDFVLCNSQATRLDVQTYFGVAPEKLSYCHLGVSVPPPEFHATRLVERAPRYGLVLGTVEPRKNLGLVLRCLGRAPELARSLEFVFVGREGWGPTFEQLRAAHGCANIESVRHLGYVGEPLKWALLRAAEFVLYPSLFEGFGLPVIEAMSVGAIVGAGETSSVAELGVPPGFLFDPTDDAEFRTVLERTMALDPSARAEISRRNREAALRFSWESFGRALEDLIVREPPPAPSGEASRLRSWPPERRSPRT